MGSTSAQNDLVFEDREVKIRIKGHRDGPRLVAQYLRQQQPSPPPPPPRLQGTTKRTKRRNRGAGERIRRMVIQNDDNHHNNKNYDSCRRLSLAWNKLRGSQVETIGKALQHNRVVHHLDFSTNHTDLRGASALANVLVHNRTLRSLCLGWNRLRDDGVREVARGLQSNPTLIRLDLPGNQITAEGAKALAQALRKQSPQQQQGCALRRLNLSWNCLQSNGVVELVQAFVVPDDNNGDDDDAIIALQELNLGGNAMDDRGARELARVLASLTTTTNNNNNTGRYRHCLCTLELWVNQIANDGAVALMQALQSTNNNNNNNTSTTLQSLDLAGNRLGVAGLKAVAQYLASCTTTTSATTTTATTTAAKDTTNSGLTRLSLKRTGMDDGGLCCLAESLQTNRVLTHLSLSSIMVTNTTNVSMKRLADTLCINQTLVRLDLRDCRLGDDHLSCLVHALSSSSLQELGLRCNQLRNRSAKALAKTLYNNNNNNKQAPHDDDNDEFSAPPPSSLIRIDLSFNPIEEEGAMALEKAVRRNHRVVECTVETIGLPRDHPALVSLLFHLLLNRYRFHELLSSNHALAVVPCILSKATTSTTTMATVRVFDFTHDDNDNNNDTFPVQTTDTTRDDKEKRQFGLDLSYHLLRNLPNVVAQHKSSSSFSSASSTKRPKKPLLLLGRLKRSSSKTLQQQGIQT